jgi:hypothetical protein
MSDSIHNMDSNGDFYHPLHSLVEDRKKRFPVRIGTSTGLDGEESQKIIGEGMTLFCNMVPSELLKEECGKKDTRDPRILHHLELEIENFQQDMPIMPHTDRKKCPHKNFSILTCTLNCVKLAHKIVQRLGRGLLDFRELCSRFVSRKEIGDVIEQHHKSHLSEMPIHLTEIYPHVPRLLQSKDGGIFPSLHTSISARTSQYLSTE